MPSHISPDGKDAGNTLDRRQFVASLTAAGAAATLGSTASPVDCAALD